MENDINYRALFQPIVSLRNSDVTGYELTIVNKDNLAASVFDIYNAEPHYRTDFIQETASYLEASPDHKLFLTAETASIAEHILFRETRSKTEDTQNFILSQIIIEINEKDFIDQQIETEKKISDYKDKGYSICISNVGSNFLDSDFIYNLNIDYLKLHPELTGNIENNKLKKTLVENIISLSKAPIIASGLKKREEITTLIRLGISFAQGDFIKEPIDNIIDIRETLRENIKEHNRVIEQERTQNFIFSSIGQIVEDCLIIGPDEKTIEAYDMIKDDPDAIGLCVIDNNQMPLGIITKANLALTLSGRYGFTLYQNKPVSSIMDDSFLSVHSTTPISTVSTIAMNRQTSKLYDFIVVTDEGKYTGIVTIKNILEKTMELEVLTAKSKNPLSGLPGNEIIERELLSCVHQYPQYSVAYIDIDNFKAYNDVYGFESGDGVIKLLTNILKKYIPSNQFIGHIGGDDFIVILNNYKYEYLYEKVVQEFNNEAVKYYKKEDRENGYIWAKSRYGTKEKFSLLTVTAVSVNNHDNTFSNSLEISEKLASLKNKAKREKAEINNQKFNQQ